MAKPRGNPEYFNPARCKSACEARSHARSERFRTGRLAKGDIGNLLASWAKANPDRPPVSLAPVRFLEDAE